MLTFSGTVPIAPVVLGLVLGPILEKNFMFSMIKTNWDFTLFFGRPVAAVLGAVTVAVWLTPLWGWVGRQVQARRAGRVST